MKLGLFENPYPEEKSGRLFGLKEYKITCLKIRKRILGFVEK